MSDKKVVYIPRMSDHAFALAAAFKSCGVSAEVLPVTDTSAIELGRKYISGKECYPCVVTTGDLLKKVMTPGFDLQNSIFFMPSGTGPCRFGQYNVLQKLILKNLGLQDVQIYSPVQDTAFYKELGLVGGDFVKTSWKGIVAIELLTKCLHETRPYELEQGITDAIYNEYLQKIYKGLCGSNGGVDNSLREARTAFESIPKKEVKKPLIGVIGEIFVRSNKFSNEDLIRKIESLGGQVWLAPVEEWIYYVNHLGLKHALIKKDLSGIIGVSVKRFFQKRVEHRYSRYFEGFLKSAHEPDTGEILRNANHYVDDTFEGETVLSIGKSIDLINHGVNGIINAMPFGCMPGTIVTALMRAVSRDYSIPSISVPFDGSESGSMTLQLEAFMEQAQSKL
ncbi:MAG: CoA protein activase, partial [Nitrospirae bacterium]|nr:CoA protein activase [Nitrospirota bacterium]